MNAGNAVLATAGTILNASANGNTVNYNGAAQAVNSTSTYYNLILSGSNTKTLATATTNINGNLTINGTSSTTAVVGLTIGGSFVQNNGTFISGAYIHSVAGNWERYGGTYTSGLGTINFNGSLPQIIGGSVSTTFNNLAINNSSGVTLTQPVSTSTLALNSGLVTTSATNMLSVTNTASASISAYSSASYVNGPLVRYLPTVLNGNYVFPIGKSGYNPLELISINSTGNLTVQAEVFDADCGGAAGTGMASLNTNRYWNASIIAGSGNFTNAQVQLTENGLDSEDAVGQSSSQSGTYSRVSTDPPSGSTIITDAIPSLNYFVIGKRPTINIVATQDGMEGSTNGVFTLSTTHQFSSDQSINITVSGSATNGTDYASITTLVTFPKNSDNATITVNVTNDFSIEATENVIVTINSGANYSVGSSSSATISIFDDDVAGVTVTPTSGLTTSEAGVQATFNIVLTSQPSANVSIAILSDDISEGTVSPSSVTFTNGDWNLPQTITVTGANDDVDDGDVAYSIMLESATSGDANYSGINADDVSVTNTDNDMAGITVTPTGGLTTTEAGAQTTFSIVLNSQPIADVSIGISSDDTSEGTVSPASVTFSSADWNSPQIITITGAPDFVVDGNVVYNIITSAANSSDGNYSGMDASDVSATNTDDDVAGISVTPTSGLNTTEAGGSASFTVVLTSQPLADVTIALSSDDPSEGTVSPASLTFTISDWDTPQLVTVTGVDGSMADGDITYHIVTGAATSGDAIYNGIDPDDVTVVNLDNDVAGISVNPVAGLITTEAGGTATFTIVLNTQPTNDVTIDLSSSNIGEGTVSPSSITFTDANWNIAQPITVSGVNDFIDDGNISYTILTSAATSIDADYTGMVVPDVTASNTDNDAVGVTVSPTAGLTTTEAGGVAAFTIVLASEPLADVTISFSSSDISEGEVSPSSITFTSGNWNSAQSINITGMNDDVDDGNIAYTIVTSAASSADGLYNNMNVPDISVSNTDNDIAGITVSPTSGLTTTEAGGQATFTIVLNSEPTSNVKVDLSSGDPTEGSVSTSSIIFTAGNWNSAQTITISGVNDNVMDGNVTYLIFTTVSPGADALYNAINPNDVSVTNTDDDVAGITVSPISGLLTTETSATATFTIKLNSEPTANVVIGISSSDVSEGTVSPSSLTFTAANWSSSQTITITGVNDFIDDGDIPYTIVTAAATSSDGNYNGMDATDVSVTNNDNDAAGITVNATSGFTTTEDGGQAQFTVVLTSQPTNDVSIAISSSDVSEGTVSVSGLTFTSGNWNVPQTVMITGVNDFSVDGDVGYTITTSTAVSSDGVYNGMDVSDVSAINTDNDIAQIVISQTSGLATDEAGGGDFFTIGLTSIPSSDVTIAISTSDATEGTATPISVVLNASNWNVPQVVNITGVNDNIDDDDIAYSIITGVSSSSDGNYNGINPSDVSVINIDDDVAGILVDPTSGLETSENLTSVTFSIVLQSEPTANVKINLSVDDNSEGTVSPSSVTFTSVNWNIAQTITVTGKNDNQSDGDVVFNVVTAIASSSDANYGGINPDDVEVTNLDNDSPGVNVSAISGNTTEAGGTATFTVVLITQPSDDVTIPISSGNTAEGMVSTSSIAFTSGNWDTLQTITVTGVNDAVADGNSVYTISVGVASSNDNDYDGIDPSDVSVTNTDLTPTITLGTNPTVCKETTTANLSYSATTNSPNQYSIDFNLAAEGQGFVDVGYTSLPSSPIFIAVPSGAVGGTYTGTLRVLNSTYNTCLSPDYTLTVTVISVAGGSVGSDQTINRGGDPSAFTSSADGSGNGAITYRWESSTINCGSGFLTISGATANDYNPSAGLTETTYYRRVIISTLNGVACEAFSNCITVNVAQISVTLSQVSPDNSCPELEESQGFNPNSDGPYSAGASEVIFKVTRNNSIATSWEFDYVIEGAVVRTIVPVSPNPQLATKTGLTVDEYEIHFYIENQPGSDLAVKLKITEVRDSTGAKDETDREISTSIKAMPVVGSFN